MDIQLLKTFLEVKTTRHFGRAAENLYLTQAAVSARVKQLESILGVPLFTRYRNNLQLTAAGERLVAHAETILVSWERAKGDITLKKHQAHVLSLGATSGLWDLMLQEALSTLHVEFPEIALRAESHGQDVLIRRLMERTLDIALLYEPTKVPELYTVEIAQAELILISTHNGESAEAAVNKNYVSVDWGTAFDINFNQSYPDYLSPVLHTSHARIALEFILTHGGSAYLPKAMVQEHLKKSLYVVDSAPVFNRPIHTSQHSENRNSKLIESALEVISKIHA